MPANEMKNVLNESIKKIIDHPLLFKKKLDIGEDAYKYLSNANNLKDFLEITSMGVAASCIAAFSWFSSLGVISQIGFSIGLVTMPIGWFALAGAGGAGLAYGIKEMFEVFKKNTMEEIPKFIKTPLDILSLNVSQILLPPSIKIALADSKFSDEERNLIVSYLVDEWGYNKNFIEKFIHKISENINSISFDAVKAQISDICQENNELKYNVIKNEILSLTKEIIEVDGEIHPTEDRMYEEFSRKLAG